MSLTLLIYCTHETSWVWVACITARSLEYTTWRRMDGVKKHCWNASDTTILIY